MTHERNSAVSRNHAVPKVAAAEPSRPSASWLRPVLLLLFVGSGCAALVYEIVWFQLLEHAIGSSAVSIAVLLATYMGGMCIGSLNYARVISAQKHPLKVYAALEFGIGLCGLLVLWLLPLAGSAYLAVGSTSSSALFLRSLLAALCLLPPTALMGATLPAISRWVERTPSGVTWLGYLYAANTLGAVLGCVLAGFYLLRIFDITVATYAAVAVNVVIGSIALRVASSAHAADYAVPAAKKAKQGAADAGPHPAVWPVLVTIGLSGLTALSAEVVWTRILSLQLGATTYTYSMILAVVLLGIAAGSYLGSLGTKTSAQPRVLLGMSQALLVIAIAWSAYLLTNVYPFQSHEAALSSSDWTRFSHDFGLSLWAVFPGALLWGASFPLALAAAKRPGKDPGRSVGSVYAANTAGAIIGSLGTSLVAMASIGSQRTQQLLIVLAVFSSLMMLLPVGIPRKRTATLAPRATALAALPMLLAAVLVWTVQPVPGNLVGYGPGSSAWQGSFGEFIYVGEGMNSSVAVSRLANGVLNYHNAGKVQASSEPGDLRLERMLGHLTTLQTESPERVLVIGCGAGVTAGAVCVDPLVKNLTIVEIEPLVPQAAQDYFSGVNEGVVVDAKTDVVIDDGRHYLMTSDEQFDAITCDPFDPWTKGAASLSTREFYESARAHLKPGGTMTVWVPLYQTRSEPVKSEIATFMSVFPNAVVWDNVSSGGGDVVLSGRLGDAPIDLEQLANRVSKPEYARVRQSLASVGFDTVDALFATYGACGDDLATWCTGAEINTDRNLRLQYLAGSGFGTIEPELVYQNMTLNRTWPDGMFDGPQERLRYLRTAMGLPDGQ